MYVRIEEKIYIDLIEQENLKRSYNRAFKIKQFSLAKT